MRETLFRPTEDIVLDKIAAQEAVDEIFDRVSPECQIIGELKLRGWTEEEIAKHLEMTQQAVDRRWQHIKECAREEKNVRMEPFVNRARRK